MANETVNHVIDIALLSKDGDLYIPSESSTDEVSVINTNGSTHLIELEKRELKLDESEVTVTSVNVREEVVRPVGQKDRDHVSIVTVGDVQEVRDSSVRHQSEVDDQGRRVSIFVELEGTTVGSTDVDNIEGNQQDEDGCFNDEENEVFNDDSSQSETGSEHKDKCDEIKPKSPSPSTGSDKAIRAREITNGTLVEKSELCREKQVKGKESKSIKASVGENGKDFSYQDKQIDRSDTESVSTLESNESRVSSDKENDATKENANQIVFRKKERVEQVVAYRSTLS